MDIGHQIESSYKKIRLIKIGLEARIGENVGTAQPVMDWIIHHSSGVINRHLVGGDGRTAYYRTYGKEFNGKNSTSVKWNFQKYLVDEDGIWIDYWYSLTKPKSSKITKHL